MPLYFFHCEGAQNFTDTTGTDLPSDREARLQAIDNAAQVLRDHAENFTGSPWWRVFVKDEAGRTIFALRLTAEHEP
jgi:hypothetical protein